MIETPRKRATTTLVVAGSMWLVVAAGCLLWALSLLVLFGTIRNFAPGGTDPLPPTPPGMSYVAWPFEHYILTGTILGGLASFGVYAGIQFLRLKAWTRPLLEAGGWCAVALTAAFGIWQSQFWSAPSGLALGLRLTTGLMMVILWALFPAVFLALVRSRSVRGAFSSSP